MALNGISTLSTKEARQQAKLDLSAAKSGDTYLLEELPANYSGNISVPNYPILKQGRPWVTKMTLAGAVIDTDIVLMTSDGFDVLEASGSKITVSE